MRILSPILLLSIACGASEFHPYADRTMYVWPDSLMVSETCDSIVDAVQDQPDQCAEPNVDLCVVTIPADSPAVPAAQDTNRAATATALSVQDTADSTYALPEMVVLPSGVPRSEANYVQSRQSFTPVDIKRKAGAAEDISRYIGSLPSVVSSLGAGYDNSLFIRGGRPSEVVFLVDGIEMENINHFSKANGSGGPIGFINSDNCKSLNFYAGNMPASFPSRLSSVVDIGMNTGSLYESRLSLGCKLTGGMLSAEGPLDSGKSSYSLSVRYVDFSALRSYVRDAGIPKIGDLYGKVFAITSDNLDLSTTALLSWNNYRYFYPIVQSGSGTALFNNQMNENETILQGGTGATLRYTSGENIHEARLMVSFRDGRDADSLGSFSDTFFVNRYLTNPIRTERDTRLRFALSSKSLLRFAENNAVTFGARLGRNSYTFRQNDRSRFEGECIVCREEEPVTVMVKQEPTRKAVTFYGIEPGAFLEYTYEKGLFQASTGIRVDYYELLDNIALSPRLSLSVKPVRLGAFSANLGLYHQFPTEMPSMIFAYLPFNAPVDSGAILEYRLLRQAKPERVWQASIGYDRFIRKKNEVRIETYYKWYDRAYDFVTPDVQDNFFLSSNGDLTLRDQTGKRRAYGMEGSLGSHSGKTFFYFVGGSLFDVKNRYLDGSWYNDWTNVGYTYSLSLGASLLNSHSVSVSLLGAGGRPFCREKIVPDCINRKFAAYDIETPWFSERLDKIVTASTRYAFSRRIYRMQTEAFVEVLNALDYTPTLEYKFNGDRFVEVKPFKITPIVGFTVNW